MLVMHVILMDILTSHGGWLCVEREVVQMPALDTCLTRSRGPSGEPVVRLGVALLDDYLEFLAGRCRPNTVLAAHTGRDTLPHDRSEAGTYGVAHGSEPASGCADRVAGGLRINGGA